MEIFEEHTVKDEPNKTDIITKRTKKKIKKDEISCPQNFVHVSSVPSMTPHFDLNDPLIRSFLQRAEVKDTDLNNPEIRHIVMNFIERVGVEAIRKESLSYQPLENENWPDVQDSVEKTDRHSTLDNGKDSMSTDGKSVDRPPEHDMEITPEMDDVFEGQSSQRESLLSTGSNKDEIESQQSEPSQTNDKDDKKNAFLYELRAAIMKREIRMNKQRQLELLQGEDTWRELPNAAKHVSFCEPEKSSRQKQQRIIPTKWDLSDEPSELGNSDSQPKDEVSKDDNRVDHDDTTDHGGGVVDKDKNPAIKPNMPLTSRTEALNKAVLGGELNGQEQVSCKSVNQENQVSDHLNSTQAIDLSSQGHDNENVQCLESCNSKDSSTECEENDKVKQGEISIKKNAKRRKNDQKKGMSSWFTRKKNEKLQKEIIRVENSNKDERPEEKSENDDILKENEADKMEKENFTDRKATKDRLTEGDGNKIRSESLKDISNTMIPVKEDTKRNMGILRSFTRKKKPLPAPAMKEESPNTSGTTESLSKNDKTENLGEENAVSPPKEVPPKKAKPGNQRRIFAKKVAPSAPVTSEESHTVLIGPEDLTKAEESEDMGEEKQIPSQKSTLPSEMKPSGNFKRIFAIKKTPNAPVENEESAKTLESVEDLAKEGEDENPTEERHVPPLEVVPPSATKSGVLKRMFAIKKTPHAPVEKEELPSSLMGNEDLTKESEDMSDEKSIPLAKTNHDNHKKISAKKIPQSAPETSEESRNVSIDPEDLTEDKGSEVEEKLEASTESILSAGTKPPNSFKRMFAIKKSTRVTKEDHVKTLVSGEDLTKEEDLTEKQSLSPPESIPPSATKSNNFQKIFGIKRTSTASVSKEESDYVIFSAEEFMEAGVSEGISEENSIPPIPSTGTRQPSNIMRIFGIKKSPSPHVATEKSSDDAIVDDENSTNEEEVKDLGGEQSVSSSKPVSSSETKSGALKRMFATKKTLPDTVTSEKSPNTSVSGEDLIEDEESKNLKEDKSIPAKKSKPGNQRRIFAKKLPPSSPETSEESHDLLVDHKDLMEDEENDYPHEEKQIITSPNSILPSRTKPTSNIKKMFAIKKTTHTFVSKEESAKTMESVEDLAKEAEDEDLTEEQSVSSPESVPPPAEKSGALKRMFAIKKTTHTFVSKEESAKTMESVEDLTKEAEDEDLTEEQSVSSPESVHPPAEKSGALKRMFAIKKTPRTSVSKEESAKTMQSVEDLTKEAEDEDLTEEQSVSSPESVHPPAEKSGALKRMFAIKKTPRTSVSKEESAKTMQSVEDLTKEAEEEDITEDDLTKEAEDEDLTEVQSVSSPESVHPPAEKSGTLKRMFAIKKTSHTPVANRESAKNLESSEDLTKEAEDEDINEEDLTKEAEDEDLTEEQSVSSPESVPPPAEKSGALKRMFAIKKTPRTPVAKEESAKTMESSEDLTKEAEDLTEQQSVSSPESVHPSATKSGALKRMFAIKKTPNTPVSKKESEKTMESAEDLAKEAEDEDLTEEQSVSSPESVHPPAEKSGALKRMFAIKKTPRTSISKEESAKTMESVEDLMKDEESKDINEGKSIPVTRPKRGSHRGIFTKRHSASLKKEEPCNTEVAHEELAQDMENMNLSEDKSISSPESIPLSAAKPPGNIKRMFAIKKMPPASVAKEESPNSTDSGQDLMKNNERKDLPEGKSNPLPAKSNPIATKKPTNRRRVFGKKEPSSSTNNQQSSGASVFDEDMSKDLESKDLSKEQTVSSPESAPSGATRTGDFKRSFANRKPPSASVEKEDSPSALVTREGLTKTEETKHLNEEKPVSLADPVPPESTRPANVKRRIAVKKQDICVMGDMRHVTHVSWNPEKCTFLLHHTDDEELRKRLLENGGVEEAPGAKQRRHSYTMAVDNSDSVVKKRVSKESERRSLSLSSYSKAFSMGEKKRVPLPRPQSDLPKYNNITSL